MVRIIGYRPKGPWFESCYDQTFPQIEESLQLSVIPRLGITRCCLVEKKDLDTPR